MRVDPRVPLRSTLGYVVPHRWCWLVLRGRGWCAALDLRLHDEAYAKPH